MLTIARLIFIFFSMAAGSSSKQHKRAGMDTQLTLENAVRFMEAVAEKLDGEKTAETFFQLVKDFIEDRIDVYKLIPKVYELLNGHPDLLEGFNAFLPEDVDPISILRIKKQEDAVSLVLKVQWRFRHNVRLYNRFLTILNQYASMQKSAAVVCQDMRTLFQGNEDLFEAIEKFCVLVPEVLKTN